MSEIDPDINKELEDKHISEIEAVIVDSKDCCNSTIDFVVEVKQTRTILKQVIKAYKELKEEVPEGIVLTGLQMLHDWRELVKYHRKRTFSAMLYQDLDTFAQLKQDQA